MKAVIFSRVSSVGNVMGNRQSNESQINDLQQYATNNNIEVVKVFSETISGGVKNEKRKVLNECLEFVKKENIDIVLVWEISRISRSLFGVQAVIKNLVENKINMFFKKEGFSLFNEDGEFSLYTPILIDCLALAGQLERTSIYERLERGKKDALANGTCKLGRKVGFRYTPEHYEKKYPHAIRLLKKGRYKLNEIQSICESKGEKIGLSTLGTLKKMYK